jgi:UDP-glucose 4-epimerase
MTGFSYFITGGAGFVGSHLSEYAVAHGHRVTIYDNMSSGRRQWLSAVDGGPGVSVIEGDVRDAARLTAALKGHDIVWHLAANGDIPGGLQNVRMDLENNTLGTFNVLNAMRATGVRSLVFTSSSTIYGEVQQFPTPEDAGPVLPISLYGASKLAGEGMISAFCHLFGMRAWIFRFGNVLGARMGHGIVYDFIHKLKRSPRELEILGDGEQQKNYFLVEECIEGMHWAVERSSAQCDVFNLGTEDTVTVKEIAAIVIEEMGLRDVRLRFTGGQRGWPGDVPQVIYDVGKMRSLGWEARHSSAEAVRVAARRLLAQFESAQPAGLPGGESA